MLVEVTAEDIRDGRKGKCKLCPIALALDRVLGKVVSVYHGSFSIDGEGSYKLPLKCSRFILDFDAGIPVKPFSFGVELHDYQCDSGRH